MASLNIWRMLDLINFRCSAKNGRISNVNLAKQVNLSPSPCLDRIKRLEQERYIEGYYAKLVRLNLINV